MGERRGHSVRKEYELESTKKVFQATVVTCDPTGEDLSVTVDGALAVDEVGRIAELGPREEVTARYPGWEVVERHSMVLMPGFVDCHVHMPQLDLIGCHGHSLLDWLKTHTFPHEERFADPSYSRDVAHVFFRQLLSHGTTTACVFATSHASSADALFTEAHRRRVRLVAGKVSSDRHVPDGLIVPWEKDRDDTLELIDRWHQRDQLLHYALTPRFAPTSSAEQLQALGQIRQNNPSVRVQSHVSENVDEVNWVRQLFPDCGSYIDVYDRAGLLGPLSLYAHGIHLQGAEVTRLAQTETSIVHCPTSNLFLGSGLCPVAQLLRAGVEVGLGTDVGGGTSLSMWATMGEAYKVAMLLGEPLAPLQLFRLATLGGAQVLGFGNDLGVLAPGRFADFQVIDFSAHPLLERRRARSTSDWLDLLFSAMFLADDRICREIYVGGERMDLDG